MSAPEKIWADARTCTVYMDGSSPITANTYEFRNSTEYTRSDLVAELAAENERMKREAAEWEVIARAKSEEALTHRREAEAMMSAIASTGAVKETDVMVCPQCEGEGTYADGLDDAACTTTCTRCESNGWIVNLSSHQRDTNTVESHKTANVNDKPAAPEHDWKAAFAAQSRKLQSVLHIPGVKEILAEPEGQQEPVAWLIAGEVWTRDREKAEDAQSRGATIEPVYTRPSERAVDWAAAMAAERTMTAHYERPLKAWELTALHEALKAAMEAGHD